MISNRAKGGALSAELVESMKSRTKEKVKKKNARAEAKATIEYTNKTKSLGAKTRTTITNQMRGSRRPNSWFVIEELADRVVEH